MGRWKKLDYEVQTPTAEAMRDQVRAARHDCGSTPPLKVHSWFDFQRNVMVVEVAVENPAEAER
ncbi:MAG TPA: hypothetical protein VFA60_13745 [Terriglobales bacterium]|nr:hypothetical protein [Terriglobales bacterium]